MKHRRRRWKQDRNDPGVAQGHKCRTRDQGYCGTSRTTGPRTAGAAGAPAAFGASMVLTSLAGLPPCPIGPNMTAATSTTAAVTPPDIFVIDFVSIPLLPWSLRLIRVPIKPVDPVAIYARSSPPENASAAG